MRSLLKHSLALRKLLACAQRGGGVEWKTAKDEGPATEMLATAAAHDNEVGIHKLCHRARFWSATAQDTILSTKSLDCDNFRRFDNRWLGGCSWTPKPE